MGISLDEVKKDVQELRASHMANDKDFDQVEDYQQESFLYDPIEEHKWRASAEFLKAMGGTKQLRHDIRKGLICGEDRDLLLLKAVECISIMADDKSFYDSVVDVLKYTSSPQSDLDAKLKYLQNRMVCILSYVDNIDKHINIQNDESCKDKLNKMLDIHLNTYKDVEKKILNQDY